jgi:hypothetical protein
MSVTLVLLREWNAWYRALRYRNGFSFMVCTATPSGVVRKTNSLHTPAQRTKVSNKNEGASGQH